MSYIRCLSNPESLYIWGEFNGNVAICAGPDFLHSMPTPAFHGILKRWWANYRGCSEREVLQYQGAKFEYITPGFKWRLSYKDWDDHIDLYDSTLVYLYVMNERRWKEKKQ